MFVKRLGYRVLKFIYGSISVEKVKSINLFFDRIYTSWIRNAFHSVGVGFFVSRTMYVEGGEHITIGNNTSINKYCILTAWSRRYEQTFNPEIVIGDGCCFGEYNHITCINKIVLGNGVLTGRWVTITDNSHGDINRQELDKVPMERKLISKGAVIIEDNVWIGDKATILPGVRIGKGSIIGANAVVSKDIPSYSVVVGTSARVIKQLK